MRLANSIAASVTRARPIISAAADQATRAPNSRLIVYATQDGGREALMTTTLDGRIKARLSGQGGDIREPAWSPARP